MASISETGNGNGTSINVPSSKRPRVSPLETEVKIESSPLPPASFWHDESDDEETESDDSMFDLCFEGPTHSATITNAKAFDCPRCKGPLVSPVYQCREGHVSCATCCTKVRTKPVICYHRSCRLPTGTIRCHTLEKVLESVTFHCINASHGCTETFKNSKILHHQKKCIYSPCTCPRDNCSFIGFSESLYKHFSEAHSHSESYSKDGYAQSYSEFSFDAVKSITLQRRQKQVFLQDSSRTTLFILDCTKDDSSGTFVSVVCVAPDGSRGAFFCDLTAVIDSNTSFNMKARVECTPIWTEEQPSLRKCLVIPKGFVMDWYALRLKLIISKNIDDLRLIFEG